MEIKYNIFSTLIIFCIIFDFIELKKRLIHFVYWALINAAFPSAPCVLTRRDTVKDVKGAALVSGSGYFHILLSYLSELWPGNSQVVLWTRNCVEEKQVAGTVVKSKKTKQKKPCLLLTSDCCLVRTWKYELISQGPIKHPYVMMRCIFNTAQISIAWKCAWGFGFQMIKTFTVLKVQ